MNIIITNIKDEETLKQYSLIVSKEDFVKEFNNELSNIQKTAKIDGFRPGKVPMHVISQNYQEKIHSTIINKMLNKFNKDIIEKDKDLLSRIYKEPIFDPIKLDQENGIELELTINCFGKIAIDYNDIKINKADDSAFNLEEEIAKKLKLISEEFAIDEKIEDVNYKLNNGDIANIDYVGKINDIPFDGGSSQSHNLEIGSQSFIDNFEEQLIGKMAGESVLVKVKFPEDYHSKNLSGKDATFDVLINCISKKIPIEITNDFVKEKFPDLNNLDELKKRMEEKIMIDKKNKDDEIIHNQIIEYFSNYQLSIPEKAIEDIKKSIKPSQAGLEKSQDSSQGDEEYYQAKKKKLISSTIIKKISTDNNIEITQEDLVKQIEKISRMFGMNPNSVADLFSNEEMRKIIISNAKEVKTLDFVASKVQIIN